MSTLTALEAVVTASTLNFAADECEATAASAPMDIPERDKLIEAITHKVPILRSAAAKLFAEVEAKLQSEAAKS